MDKTTLRDIRTKKPWGRIQPDVSLKHLLSTPRTLREETVNEYEPQFKILTQADMLREYYPSGHLINSEQYYPNIHRQEIVAELDDTGHETGKYTTKHYIEHVPRYSFAFQQIITIKRLIHLIGNDVQWDTTKNELTKEEEDNIFEFKRGWLAKSMELAIYECVKSSFIVGDAAIVGYLDKGKFGWKMLSYFSNQDILYPHYDSMGKLSLFARQYNDYADDGKAITTWLEVWDETYLTRYRRDNGGAAKVVNSIKNIFGLSGFTEVSKEKHQFPFIPVAYVRRQDGCVWNASQDSIDGYELAFSEMAQNNHMFGIPIMYLQGDEVEASHDMNGSIRVLTMGKEDKAGYLTAQSASESYQRQLDINYKMIFKQSFAVEAPQISGNSDISGAAIKILYSDANEIATTDANDYQPFVEQLSKIYAYGYGMEAGHSLDFQTIPLSPWIKPYMPVNESSMISDLATAVGSGFISKKTASERASFYADTNEWEKIIREEKEKQQADLIYELDKVNKSNIGNE